MFNYYVYEYNETGERTKISEYNSDGECDGYTIYEYDDGQLIRKQEYNGDGTLEQETKYN